MSTAMDAVADKRKQDFIDAIRMRAGGIYMILEEKNDLALGMFEGMVQDKGKGGKSFSGVYITRNYPLEVRAEYDLDKVPIIWLTTNMNTKETAINPSSITRLNMSVVEFIDTSQRGVVLIDCLEYLVTQNTFETVLRLMQSWNDRLVGSRVSVLVSLDPLTLTLQQLHLLKKEMQDVLVID